MNRKNPNTGTAKKATKKVAKKTYSKKKTPPKPRKLTLDEFMAITAENHAKTEARMAKSREETEARMAKSREETDKALQRLTENIDRMSNRVDRVSENIGGVNNRLGTIMELIVVPKLRHNMNAQGHNFDLSEPDKLIRGVIAGRKEDITQVDLLLRGPTEALAVEVKTRLRELHVREHLERLQDLRDREDDADIKDKKLFGAVVGVAIDDTAKKIARENGLYIVKIHEEEGKLDIEKPEICRTW
ncbi:MAG: hypothetical protein LBC59_00790 [Chitinispirillales bacterium]|jgi:glutaredoxin 2|nr:hypothetical protein [Chitinispirillales bacterium]